MQVLIATQPGGPEVMGFAERPTPSPGPDELLIEVHATAINRADLRQRTGEYPLPPDSTDVFGLELAGEVVRVGNEVAGWSIGDRACALVPGGGHAELAALPAGLAMPVPRHLSYQQAAAIPESFLTAYDNLRRRGGVSQGTDVLLHGGSSGLGTAGIQLVNRFGGRTFVTCRGAKAEACLGLGAAAAIDYRQEDFVAAIAELTGGRGVDVILDHIGGAYLDRNLDALAMDGRLVIVGTMNGDEERLDIRKLMARRGAVTGTLLRPRTVAEKSALIAEAREEVWPGFEDGTLQPVVDVVLPWERIAEAHERMERSEHVGKIVLAVR